MAAVSLRRGPSRRSFLRLGGLAATLPLVTEHHLAWAAIRGGARLAPKPGATGAVTAAEPVMINANENPLGPCPDALSAIVSSAKTGGRYDATNELDRLTKAYAEQIGLPSDHVVVYAGSSEPLHYTVLAFTSANAPYVTADPGYEAGMLAAQIAGAPILKVPLTPTYAHDIRAMVTASPSAGVIYICNPNNPTGTVTPRQEILWAEQNKPKGSVLLIDEAYIHFSDQQSVVDLVAQGKDVVLLRTFSKIYGMAGIRCGVAMGRPDLLQKLQRYGMNSMPVTALAAAHASLNDANLVETRRKINTDNRAATFAWLDTKGWQYTPSVSNCFMVDTKRPADKVIAAMQARNVYIGRVWPAWPTHVRVSVGTPMEMAAFQTAFSKVMADPGIPAQG